jgi:hypothetical protein
VDIILKTSVYWTAIYATQKRIKDVIIMDKKYKISKGLERN